MDVNVDVIVYRMHAYDKSQGVLYRLTSILGLSGERSHSTAWALVMRADGQTNVIAVNEHLSCPSVGSRARRKGLATPLLRLGYR